MSSDWMKMRTNLWDDPRVGRIADDAGSGEAAVIGALYWLWAAADEHSVDGMLHGMTLRQIDRKTGVPGFAASVASIGWITETPDGVQIVRFDEHNGATAKRRAAESRRKMSSRAADNLRTGCGTDVDESGEVSASDADNLRTGCGSFAHLEQEQDKDQNLLSSAAPNDPKNDVTERLAVVTADAIAAFNDSALTKRNGGNLPNVSATVGSEKRRAQVRRCLRTAREICRESTGSPLVTPEFWAAYFDLAAADGFYSGRQSGGPGHENYVPDFELLTREDTMLRLYDRQVAA